MLRLIWAGKTRDPLLAGLVERYLERIRPWTPLRVDEVAAAPSGTPGSAARQEGLRILERLPAGAAVVALDPAGRETTSEELAGWLERRLRERELVLVAGGHEGLSEAVLARAGERLSLSRLTLTHEMARVLLVEQIYRAFTILHGQRYHHGGSRFRAAR